MWKTANMSLRTCVVIKQMQSNPIDWHMSIGECSRIAKVCPSEWVCAHAERAHSATAWWFALLAHSQFVDYGGLHSSVWSIKTGVPQGLILGPLLFIIYMNDINISSQKLSLYYMLTIQLWHSPCVHLPIVMILPLPLSLMLLTKNSQQYQISYRSTDSLWMLRRQNSWF